jgi:hypothetical protein
MQQHETVLRFQLDFSTPSHVQQQNMVGLCDLGTAFGTHGAYFLAWGSCLWFDLVKAHDGS